MIEELDGAELLEYRVLEAADGRGDEEAGPVGGVRCGRPLLYPLPVTDLPPALQLRAEGGGERYVGALFAFDLDRLPPGHRYVGARFEVSLDDPDSLAVRVDVDADALGVTFEGGPATADAAYTIAAARQRPGWLRRLTGREQAPRAWATGVQSTQFGWLYEDTSGELLLPRNYGMHAVLAVPAGATRLSGTIAVQVEVVAGRKRTTSVREDLEFSEALSAAGSTNAAAVRMCMAADVAGFSKRGNVAAERIQQEIVDLLSQARRAAGIPDEAVRPQPQGDGQFTVLPIGIDESAVIPRLLGELDRALRELNDNGDDRLRMRVALHRGLVKEGANGWIGTASIAVHRILDSPPLRSALTDHPQADFVLGVPDVLYRDVVVHAQEPPLPEDFTAVTVSLPEKGFVEHAWVYVGQGEKS